jgi:uncharacterized membrane protein
MTLQPAHILMMYATTAVVFFVIDLFWLGWAAKGLYDKYIGGFLKEQVNWAAALLFYGIYIGGIQLFVLTPALQGGSGILRTAVMGGLLGMFAYSTFDLTALALFRDWPVTVTVLDIIWGTVLTGGTSAAVLWIVRNIYHFA